MSSGAVSSGLDRFVSVLDRARAAALGAALRVPGLRAVLHQRSRRIEARAGATIVIALALSAACVVDPSCRADSGGSCARRGRDMGGAECPS